MADAALYLASDKAAWITGIILDVAGGQLWCEWGTTTQPIMAATDLTGIDNYMDGLIKFTQAVGPGSTQLQTGTLLNERGFTSHITDAEVNLIYLGRAIAKYLAAQQSELRRSVGTHYHEVSSQSLTVAPYLV